MFLHQPSFIIVPLTLFFATSALSHPLPPGNLTLYSSLTFVFLPPSLVQPHFPAPEARSVADLLISPFAPSDPLVPSSMPTRPSIPLMLLADLPSPSVQPPPVIFPPPPENTPTCPPQRIWQWHGSKRWGMMIMVFVVYAAVFLVATLSVGIMSVDPLRLKVWRRMGHNEHKRNRAEQILDLRGQNSHWVLVSLILANLCLSEVMPYLLRHLFIAELWWKPYAITTVIASVIGEFLPLVFAPWAILAVTGRFRFVILAIKYVSCPLSWSLGKCIYWLEELVASTLAKNLEFVEDDYLQREDLGEWVRLHEEEEILEYGITDVFKRCMDVGTETVGMGEKKVPSGKAGEVEEIEYCLVVDVKRKVDAKLKEVVGMTGEGEDGWIAVLDRGQENDEGEGYWRGGKVRGWVVGVVERKAILKSDWINESNKIVADLSITSVRMIQADGGLFELASYFMTKSVSSCVIVTRHHCNQYPNGFHCVDTRRLGLGDNRSNLLEKEVELNIITWSQYWQRIFSSEEEARLEQRMRLRGSHSQNNSFPSADETDVASSRTTQTSRPGVVRQSFNIYQRPDNTDPSAHPDMLFDHHSRRIRRARVSRQAERDATRQSYSDAGHRSSNISNASILSTQSTKREQQNRTSRLSADAARLFLPSSFSGRNSRSTSVELVVPQHCLASKRKRSVPMSTTGGLSARSSTTSIPNTQIMSGALNRSLHNPRTRRSSEPPKVVIHPPTLLSHNVPSELDEASSTSPKTKDANPTPIGILRTLKKVDDGSREARALEKFTGSDEAEQVREIIKKAVEAARLDKVDKVDERGRRHIHWSRETDSLNRDYLPLRNG